MEKHPLAVDPVRQQRRVLVLGLPDDPVPHDRAEVLRRGEVDGRARGAVRGARDHPALELRDEDDARILESPELALDAVLRREQGLRIDDPPVDPVRRACDREM